MTDITAERPHPGDGVWDHIRSVEKVQEWHAQRLVRSEEWQRGTSQDIAEIKAMLSRLDAVANMGRGALWLALRLGAMVSVAAATAEAVHRLWH